MLLITKKWRQFPCLLTGKCKQDVIRVQVGALSLHQKNTCNTEDLEIIMRRGRSSQRATESIDAFIEVSRISKSTETGYISDCLSTRDEVNGL